LLDIEQQSNGDTPLIRVDVNEELSFLCSGKAIIDGYRNAMLDLAFCVSPKTMLPIKYKEAIWESFKCDGL